MADCFALQEPLRLSQGAKKAAGFDLRELPKPEKHQKTIKNKKITKISKKLNFLDLGPRICSIFHGESEFELGFGRFLSKTSEKISFLIEFGGVPWGPWVGKIWTAPGNHKTRTLIQFAVFFLNPRCSPMGRPYFPYPWAVHIFPWAPGPPQIQSKN